MTSNLPDAYPSLLADVKRRVAAARVGAALAVNREMIRLYWDIGRIVVTRQQAEGWGTAVTGRLATDLKKAFPDASGFSKTNLDRMKRFFGAYSEATSGTMAISPQAVGKLESEGDRSKSPQAVGQLPELPNLPVSADFSHDSAIPYPEPESSAYPIPEPLAEIPWGHNITLLEKLQDHQQRLWYARQTTVHGWSRAVLVHQIESDLYSRQAGAVTNFERTLPAPQSDLANELLKSPYALDFLGVSDDVSERQLETALTDHLQRFLVELGRGFAFVGRQYEIEVGGQDYRLDLLFYHLHLRCFVVIDLKVEPFKPEFAGKMSFYLAAVDDLLRHPSDQPTIGLLLCKERNQVIVEYALRDSNRPMGVATYQLLPEKIKSQLPSPDELREEMEGLTSDIDS